MDLLLAVKILEHHNKWRRDNVGDMKMTNPKELGQAIDIVCDSLLYAFNLYNANQNKIVKRKENLNDIDLSYWQRMDVVMDIEMMEYGNKLLKEILDAD